MHTASDQPELVKAFLLFSRACERDEAPRYRDICRGVAGDDELLSLLADAPARQRRPNLLLAAVHDLLLAGTDHPLARHYPTVAAYRAGAADGSAPPQEGEPVDPYPLFADFCRVHRDEVRALVATRATQTNEIGRCAALLPAIAVVAAAHPGPLALVDLGTSAGLNLLFDRYGYTYTRPEEPGPPLLAGDRASRVQLGAELRAGHLPDLTVPQIDRRVGIDASPIDVTDADAARWLLACQWPDHLDRFAHLAAALDLAATIADRPQLVTGDFIGALPDVLADLPADAHCCIMHTWAAAYLPPERQAELVEAIASAARTRPVSWLFAESPYEVPALPVPPAPGGVKVKGATALVLAEPEGSPVDVTHAARRLADVHSHGRWLCWWG